MWSASPRHLCDQRGQRTPSHDHLLTESRFRGYDSLTPNHLGWTREETLAYLASVMDCDGNFRIPKRRVSEMRWPHYRINVRCSQVSPSPAVMLLASTFGGKVKIKRERQRDHRDLAAWDLYDRTAVPAIRALLPHLRVKQADACLLLKLRCLKSLGKEDLTTHVHRTRWGHAALMRKRTYSSPQVDEFERIRQALIKSHSRNSEPRPTAPEPPG